MKNLISLISFLFLFSVLSANVSTPDPVFLTDEISIEISDLSPPDVIIVIDQYIASYDTDISITERESQKVVFAYTQNEQFFNSKFTGSGEVGNLLHENFINKSWRYGPDFNNFLCVLTNKKRIHLIQKNRYKPPRFGVHSGPLRMTAKTS